jgi:hypothetical protein
MDPVFSPQFLLQLAGLALVGYLASLAAIQIYKSVSHLLTSCFNGVTQLLNERAHTKRVWNALYTQGEDIVLDLDEPCALQITKDSPANRNFFIHGIDCSGSLSPEELRDAIHEFANREAAGWTEIVQRKNENLKALEAQVTELVVEKSSDPILMLANKRQIKILELEAELKVARATISSLMAGEPGMFTSNIQYRTPADTCPDSVAHWQKVAKLRNDEITGLNRTIGDYKKAHAEDQREIRKLKTQVSGLKDSVSYLEAELKSNRKKLNRLRKENRTLDEVEGYTSGLG